MNEKKKVFVTTTPFGTVSPEPLALLEKEGIECIINPLPGSKMTLADSAEFLRDTDYIIAGLAEFTPDILDYAKNLKCIVRVGVGINNLPLEELKRRGIRSSYTPDAPTRAVAEITIGMMIDALRRFTFIDRSMRKGIWHKYMGEMLEGKTVGIIGVGRIGKRVIELLQPFNVRIIANDIQPDLDFAKKFKFSFVAQEEIFTQSDVVSLHLSKSEDVYHLVNDAVLAKMKKNAVLINLSRGGIIDEDALYRALVEKRIAGAALDVFEQEPYTGILTQVDNVLLTAHIGAGTTESRRLMEVGAVEEVIRFHRGLPLLNQLT